MTQYYQDNLGGWHELDDPIYEYLLIQNHPSLTFTPKTEAEYLAAIAPKPTTLQEQKDAISNAIQSMLDTKAQSLRYDSILSARSYAGYVNPFQTEALKLADWAANCWATAGSIEAQVNAGTMLMPTVDQALTMMPIYQ
ncbi:MAG TPA: hypothetical protein VFM18_09935 [Methanosarcina sp.]|nr:hypothetical protein [Methanosarcina sp.]